MSIDASGRWMLCGLALTSLGGCGSSSNGGSPDGGMSGQDGSTGGPGDAGVDGSSGDAASEGGPPATPTVSSWLGTNVDADLPYADVTYMMGGFNTAAAQLDANGYPVAGASGTSQADLGFLLPSGTYNISYVGTGSLTVSGIGALVGSWQTVSGEQRAQVKITGTPGNFGQFLTFNVANTAGQTVTGIHLYLPGIDYDSKVPFNPQFLSGLTPFRAMRFMGWMDTNASKLANWSDRPASSHYGASTFGVPYEFIAELVNETGKDAWINVPELATSSFITQFATFMATNLDFTRIAAARTAAGSSTPFQLIVENSNETWNTAAPSFTAYSTFLAAANANPSRYTGAYAGTYGPSFMSSDTNLMKVGQYQADRLVSIVQAFTTALQAVDHADALAPVLSGWALGAVYNDEGLSFIQANYGDPKKYVSYVAIAPYFSTPDDTTTGSLDTLFPALQANITSMDAVFQDFEKLATQYGVTVAGYEGGQSLSGTTNEPIKHLAQFDIRMYQTYGQYLTFWRQHFTTSLFMNFTLAGSPGEPENIFQYGFWGALPGIGEDLSTCGKNLPTLAGTETVASVSQYCPKYQALADHVPQ